MLTADQISIVTQRRAEHKSWDSISKEIGVSSFTIRAYVVPGFRARHRVHVQTFRQNYYKNGRRCTPNATGTPQIPPQVLAERDHRLSLVPRSLSAVMFNDPLPGYSALDKLHANAN